MKIYTEFQVEADSMAELTQVAKKRAEADYLDATAKQMVARKRELLINDAKKWFGTVTVEHYGDF